MYFQLELVELPMTKHRNSLKSHIERTLQALIHAQNILFCDLIEIYSTCGFRLWFPG